MGVEVQRLHEDTEDNDGENPLRRWPTTKGNNYYTGLNDTIKTQVILFSQKYETLYVYKITLLKDTYTNPMVCQCLPMQAVMHMMLLTQ